MTYFSGAFHEPCGYIGREIWGQGGIDASVICIEPRNGFRSEKFRNYSRSVYVTACQRLKLQPFSELGCAGLATKYYVLMTDAVHAFTIEARFVGGDHPRKQRLRIVLIAYALRTFMHAEIVADSMACSVAEVAFCLP